MITYPDQWTIKQYPDACLREVCETVSHEYLQSPAFKDCVERMRELLYLHKGIGLAAPQCGWNARVFLMQMPGSISAKVFVNPAVVYETNFVKTAPEGCLSFHHGIVIAVTRAVTIGVNYVDETGYLTQNQQLMGLESRCFLHENDHLLGILITDRATQERTMRL